LSRLSEAQRRAYRRNPIVLALLLALSIGILFISLQAGSLLGAMIGFALLAASAYWAIDALLVKRLADNQRRTFWNLAFVVLGVALVLLPIALGSAEVTLSALVGVALIVVGGSRLLFAAAVGRGYVSGYGEFVERLTDASIVVFLWAFRITVVAVVVVGSALTLASGKYALATWLSLIRDGATLGSVYALIALGYTMVYGILRMINFAHGEIFMSGMFGGYFTAVLLRNLGLLNAGPVESLVSVILMMLVAAVLAATIAVLVERVAYRPLRDAPRLVPLISAIGASFFLQYTFRGLFGAGTYVYPTITVFEVRVTLPLLDALNMKWIDALVIGSAVVMMTVLYWFVMRTRTGTAIRAVSEDKAAAALMGINVDRAIVTTFAVGAAMAGAAGVLYGVLFRQIDFYSGFLPGVKAFTAAVLGGIGNVPGAMLGGLFLGEIESLGPQLFLDGLGVPATNQLKDAIAFTMLVLVLVFRPSGILGERIARQRA
jgi:branched-chain amino acid transport system permease protein